MRKKTFVVAIILILAIGLTILGVKILNKEYVIKLNHLHRLNLNYPIQDYLIVDDKILYSKANSLYHYNLKTRNQKELYSAKATENIAISDSKFICIWENFFIDSKDEIATKITIGEIQINKDFRILEVSHFQTNYTIRPISCNSHQIIAEDNYPNSLERKYMIDLKTGSIEELTKSNREIIVHKTETTKLSVKTNSILLLYDNKEYTIDFANIFTKAEYTKFGFLLTDQAEEFWHAER